MDNTVPAVKRRKKRKLSPIYLGLVLVFMYIPIIIVIVFSFNANKASIAWDGFTLRWYEELFRDQALIEAIGNSLLLALISCAASVVIGTIGAVGMARARFKTLGLLQNASMLPLMIPEIILGMAFLAFFSFLSLPFGMLTLVLAHTSFCVPYIFMNVRSRLAGLDPAIAEAARDLGAGRIRAFFDVTLPLIVPGIVSGALLAFAMSLDDVVISFFVTGPTTNTMPVKVYSMLKVGVTPEINALCAVMLAVTLVVVVAYTIVGKKSK